MGKASKYKGDPKNISKHASSTVDSDEAKTAKERINTELHLLQVRKQAMSLNKTSPSKTKKGSIMKSKKTNIKQQKKVARALAVADKEDARIAKQSEKKEFLKVRKQDWH
ncbi:unnamed protein product [Cunninghamella echinulata]